MTTVLKHAVLPGTTRRSYRGPGWCPKVKVTLLGPSVGAELVATWTKPDGSAWVEQREETPDLGEGELHTLWLGRNCEEEDQIAEIGTVGLTLRHSSELDGIDELLHSGTVSVVRVGDDEVAVDYDWMVTSALVCLDADDSADAPPLVVSAFFKGDVESYAMDAYLFRDGSRVAQASRLSDGAGQFTASDDVIGREVVATFGGVRGWNNLTGQGWGDADWILLDASPGSYEVKFTRGGKKVARVVGFEVADGRLVKSGRVELDAGGRAVMWARATVDGDLDGQYDEAAYDACAAFGDTETAAIDWPMDSIYALRTEPEAPAEAAFDDETTELIESLGGRAANALSTWEQDMADGIAAASFPSQFLSGCEVVIMAVDDWEERRAALPQVPDTHVVELYGGDASLGEVAVRMAAMRRQARASLGLSADQGEAKLAPYRALLSGDKLAVFEDHPAPDFLYYTTNRKVIETPEELAEAEFWYFEGAADTHGTGSIGGSSVSVSVTGWRVLGWRFAADGSTVDEFSEQGSGTVAPKSAFKHS